MTGDAPKQWVKWLSLVEWWYNTNYHTSIHSTPFEIVYGVPPLLHILYFPRDSSVAVVD